MPNSGANRHLASPRPAGLTCQMRKLILDVIFEKFCCLFQALMKEWGVRAVPNFRFFRNGEKVHSHTGAKEEDLRDNFMKHYDAVPAEL